MSQPPTVPAAGPSTRLEWRIDDTAWALIGLIAAGILWKLSPTSLAATIFVCDLIACAVLWLAISVPPWFRKYRRRDRLLFTGIAGLAFYALIALLIVRGDLGDSRRPDFRGDIVSWVKWQRPNAPGDPPIFLITVEMVNDGGPSYATSWQPFFIASDGKRVDGYVYPAPSPHHPITMRTDVPAISSTWSAEFSITRTFEAPVQSNSGVAGSLMAAFPQEGPQPPEGNDVQVSCADRLGRTYTFKLRSPNRSSL